MERSQPVPTNPNRREAIGLAVGAAAALATKNVAAQTYAPGPFLALGPGTHGLDSADPDYNPELAGFVSSNRQSHNVTLIGKGPGATHIYGHMRFDGWHPQLSGFTLFPGFHTGWSLLELNNPGSPWVSNVWLHPVANMTGLAVRTTDWGAVSESIKWPKRGEETGGARHSMGTYRDVFIYGEGRGWSFDDQTTQSYPGQFFNHVKIFGGHTKVDDVAMLFSSVLNAAARLELYSHPIDAAPDKGLRFGENVKLIRLYGGGIEGTGEAKADHALIVNGDEADIRSWGWPVHKRA